jgi:hypothetical protein
MNLRYVTLRFTSRKSSIWKAGLVLIAPVITVLLLSCGSTSESSIPSAPTGQTPSSVGISVAPASIALYSGTTTTFRATDATGAMPSVTWSLQTIGSSYPSGLISSTGLYQSPSPVLTPQTVIVTAALVTDSSVTAKASISLKPLANQERQTLPIAAGTSGNNVNTGHQCCAGTLGAVLSDEAGEQYLLSNNHILGRSGFGVPGEAILQPGNLDTLCTNQGQNQVATLTYAAPLTTSNADAAVAQVVPGAVRTDGAIIALGSPDRNGNATPAPPASTPLVPSA